MNKTKEIEKLKACLTESERHVARQVDAGKHEQDRNDAIEWSKKWRGDLKRWGVIS